MSDRSVPSRPSRRPLPSAPGEGDGESFAALFEASQDRKSQAQPAARIKAGDLISCRVLAIGQSSVFVSAGDKAEGAIDLAEFRDPASGELRVAVGDVIQATVIDDGGRSGSAVLTRMLGRTGHAAAELEQALELAVPVEGLVTAETKGGFEVLFGSVRAFCPGSQIDLRRTAERAAASDYVGKRFAFRVLKVENDGRNVVVSRRDLLEEQAAEEAAKTWQQIHVGAVLEGTVRSLRDFGAFVDLGGVDGMIHVSEMAWSRVKDPSELLELGQRVRVQVIKVGETDAKGRATIGLSLRALAEDPWSTLASRFPAGTTIRGSVTRLESFGAFVQVEPGVEGLVHISKIALERRLNHARQALSVGQDVEVTVLAVDVEARRLGLSMVEEAGKARSAELEAEKREQQQVMQAHRGSGSLGTFADLLEKARGK
ncbi:MAG TPA: S1 RNA-binding domain-containing protein [Candidatus Binatia bacterium]|jgi:small subunit ribosomal protein S1